MAALTASNNVGEGRRSDQAAGLSHIMRPFNRSAAKTENKSRKEKGRKSIERIEGRQRVEMFKDACDFFNARADLTRANVGEDRYRQLMSFIDGDANRISRIDLEARKETFAKGIKKPRKITKSEQCSCGPDVPAQMGGGITIQNLQAKYDKQIEAEIRHRRIELTAPYNKLKHKEKRDLLRLDEMKNLLAEGKAQDGILPRDIKYIVPRSAEMIALVSTINRNN